MFPHLEVAIKDIPWRENWKEKENKEKEKDELKIMLLIACLRPKYTFVKKHFMDSINLVPHSHTYFLWLLPELL